MYFHNYNIDVSQGIIFIAIHLESKNVRNLLIIVELESKPPVKSAGAPYFPNSKLHKEQEMGRQFQSNLITNISQ